MFKFRAGWPDGAGDGRRARLKNARVQGCTGIAAMRAAHAQPHSNLTLLLHELFSLGLKNKIKTK